MWNSNNLSVLSSLFVALLVPMETDQPSVVLLLDACHRICAVLCAFFAVNNSTNVDCLFLIDNGIIIPKAIKKYEVLAVIFGAVAIWCGPWDSTHSRLHCCHSQQSI